MSVYATIDLDSLICKLSDDDLSDFMLETFRDRVSDESHVSLITEMFKVMYDTDRKRKKYLSRYDGNESLYDDEYSKAVSAIAKESLTYLQNKKE